MIFKAFLHFFLELKIPVLIITDSCIFIRFSVLVLFYFTSLIFLLYLFNYDRFYLYYNLPKYIYTYIYIYIHISDFK
jgi:hypothetical protein